MSTVRYKTSVDPITTDGRDIDPKIAHLSGEAADQQASGSAGKHIEKQSGAWTQLPQPQSDDPTYYDRPLLNESVWGWAIPTYYYFGGLSGSSLALGAALQLQRSPKFERLIRRCHWIGFIGCCISGALLVYDLGKPQRFLNMLRVFRPTSPMNVGAWILSGTSAAASAALILRIEPAGYVAGVFGMGLATYTGVLVSNTAVPLWNAARKVLPVLFAASAVTSVGALFELFDQSEDESRVTHLFGTIGKAAEITASVIAEQHASQVQRVGRPFKRGFSGFIWRTAAVLTAGSLVASLLPGQTRNRRLASGIVGTVGSMMMRFALEYAGNASARDPRASFHSQRGDKS